MNIIIMKIENVKISVQINDNSLISSADSVWPCNEIQWPRVELAGRRSTLTTLSVPRLS